MTWYSDLCRALDIRLNELDPKPSIAWENTDFEPTESTAFIAPFLVPADSEIVQLDFTQDNRGIYQVDFYMPLGLGTNDLRTLLGRVYDLFHGQTLVYGTVEVEIGGISPRYIGREQSWYRAQLNIEYRCYSN